MAGTASSPKPGWYDTIQDEVYTLLESRADGNIVRKAIIYFIAAMIVLNVLAVILETKQSLYFEYAPYFHIFDLFTLIVFTIEYVLRVWCCVKNPLYSSPVKGRLRYALSPLALIDLISIAPFYLPLIFPIELRMLRLLRLLRVFRVLKLGRYSNAFETFVDVLKSKKEELVITVIMVIIVLILSSSALYAIEREAQPNEFGSIPDAMWWAVVTLATVGYGDVYPITALGKFIAAFVALAAIGLFALPAGILATGFIESINRRKLCNGNNTAVCPQCGTEFDIHAGIAWDNPPKTNKNESSEDVGEVMEELMR
ncbi:MAG: ion transporter [Methanoregula sp.]|nr:ion transporter [Methanoregula sp.]